MSLSFRWSLAVAAVLAVAAPLAAQRAPVGEAQVAPISASIQTTARETSGISVPAFGSTSAASAALSFAVPLSPLVPGTMFESPLENGAPATPAVVPPLPSLGQSQSVALMIVGGAGLIVGSLIDGDTGTIVMVGGGVVGLIGLFQYLR